MSLKTVYVGPIWRYDKFAAFSSAFDPLDDLIAHLDFLTAREFAVELLVNKHGVGRADARTRADALRSHARLAAHYVMQARQGPADVAFVAGYYGVLNLLKICIITSPLYRRLASNRLHGASYNPAGPASRILPSEEIKVHTGGAIPLYFELLTGRSVTNATRIKLGDIYPFISDVSHEWDQVRAKPGVRFRMRYELETDGQSDWARFWVDEPDSRNILPRYVPALSGFKQQRGLRNSFVAKRRLPKTETAKSVFADSLDRRFLYFPVGDLTTTAIMRGPLAMPEEVPIVLALFHLSSVARYNPEFLERLASSKYWPTVSAMRVHGIYRYLVLFWSYMHQANVYVERPAFA